MRLTAQQTRLIHDTAMQMLGTDARVVLFGSRTDDAAKGGDVDLFIETRESPGLWRQAQLQVELEKRLGLPVDLILRAASEPESPIHRIARLTGVALS